ncbi:hypothetical protein BpHYR1_022110 [Brachionus plicatilis]|uniref:RNA-directed DNA polymerase from mobile element jockey-like n=1 Tax=Brachionus plicatilis TaxID=10195 RepID=A0A3M7SQ60_BRAPC|nr:hypothetical protein BpHYR1_022110 [Brachionus plicatilis]
MKQNSEPKRNQILSNKKWGLNQNTLGNLYKSLVGSILDYSFPCLNSFSENNIKKLQAIQNTAVRSILKLKYDTPSNIVHHEAFNKLKLLTVSNRLFELSERYVGTGLSHSIPLVFLTYSEGALARSFRNSICSDQVDVILPIRANFTSIKCLMLKEICLMQSNKSVKYSAILCILYAIKTHSNQLSNKKLDFVIINKPTLKS